jgi:hypothetical protein
MGLLACEAKKSKVISATGEDAEAADAVSADGQLPKPAKTYTQVTVVKEFEEVRCTRFFDCFPTELVVKIQNAKDVPECVNNRIADIYNTRRDGEGKPMFCETGETFHNEQANLCLDWLRTSHCGDFVQAFMATEPFAICQFVCTTPMD